MLAAFIAAALSVSGCRKSDVTLVVTSTYGKSENTIGRLFEHYYLFLSKSWTAVVDKQGRHYVTFTTGIPADKVLRVAARDSRNWLTVEKKYSNDVFPLVRAAYLHISFSITSPESFRLSTMRLGLSTGTKTVWSPDFSAHEKEVVMEAIDRNSPEVLPVLARYADPSFREGSTLYARLTGKNIKDYH
ncbi:MAG TPA: hypothetical protein PKM41_05455 [Deltaproteobacteria bacterium]|jgi:hypothetical protein|nr:hypothetical protein [Deltaproteobacteria bacterium]HOI06629.1 hypothetical protein [Deltaproteobacteria bacterium]